MYSVCWAASQWLTRPRYSKLIAYFGDLSTAWEELSHNHLHQAGIDPKSATSLMQRIARIDPIYEQELVERNHISVVSIDDDSYSPLLRQIPDAPIFLYAKGDIALMKTYAIGFVGTRKMSHYGKKVASECGTKSALAGITTVSGLARGIDCVVHEKTLEGKGKTVSVLGLGIDIVLKNKNNNIAHEIGKNGLLLSEYHPMQPALPHNFPRRNRIIAGLSQAIVVIEAPKKSGALITADLAIQYNREVFAVPGSIYSEVSDGCNTLIEKGESHIVLNFENIINTLNFESFNSPALSIPLDIPKSLESVYAFLSDEVITVQEIYEKVDMQNSEITAQLTELEIFGLAKQVGVGGWVRG